MLDIKLIRDNTDFVKKNLERRNGFDTGIVDELIKVDDLWRNHKFETDNLKSVKNKENLKISEFKKSGKNIDEQVKKVKDLNDKIAHVESLMQDLEDKRLSLLLKLPNMLDEQVPFGLDDEQNKPIRFNLEKPNYSFPIRNFSELCEMNDWADLETASKTSGARFYYLKNELVLLQVAIYNYALNKLAQKGYVPVEVPPMLKRNVIGCSVSLEDFEDVIYKIEDEDLYMIGTSEHALAALHINHMFNHKDLPVKYAGLSACFRKEAGVTKDSKGIFRVHNFNKIEQFVFCKPEESDNYHKEITQNAEEIFKELELHYQIVDICTGDMGSFATRKFDLEAWLPGQQRYREMVSSSNYRDYGARRLNCRYQNEKNEIEFVHTLNSTAIALTRAMIAIIEQHQTQDGNVIIPVVLRPYMGERKLLIQR